MSFIKKIIPTDDYIIHKRTTKKGTTESGTPLKRLHLIDKSRYSCEILRELRKTNR